MDKGREAKGQGKVSTKYTFQYESVRKAFRDEKQPGHVSSQQTVLKQDMSMVFSSMIKYAPNIVVKNTGRISRGPMSLPEMLEHSSGLCLRPKATGKSPCLSSTTLTERIKGKVCQCMRQKTAENPILSLPRFIIYF